MFTYRIEHEPNGKQEVVELGAVTLSAALSKASRLSKKPGSDGDPYGHCVYLVMSDVNGDQGQYVYFDGGLAYKDLVSDWNK